MAGMRTVMVNSKHRRKSGGGGARPTIVVVKQSAPRRRNAAMPAARPVVMASNPPRRRRRKNPAKRRVVVRRHYRKNPFDLRMIADVGLRAGGAAVASYFLNKSVISTLGTTAAGGDTQYGMMIRNLTRVALAAAGVAWVGGTMGAAWAGSMLYPAVFEMDNWWRRQGSTTAANAAALANDRRYKEEALPGDGSTAELSAALERELEAALNNYEEAY